MRCVADYWYQPPLEQWWIAADMLFAASETADGSRVERDGGCCLPVCSRSWLVAFCKVMRAIAPPLMCSHPR